MNQACAGLLLTLVAGPGCGLADDLAEELGSPFGLPDVDVLGLEADAIAGVIAEVMGRFRAYAALRDAIPFDVLTGGTSCSTLTQPDATTVRVDTDLGCAFGAAGGGQVTLVQDGRVVGASNLPRFALTYAGAVAGGLRVDGTEVIDQTTDGAAEHDLDLVQDDAAWRYVFRASDLAPDTPAFDYLVPSASGNVPVRITNPETIGGFATVILFGRDGLVRCDLRNSDPDLGVRGRCDNGVVFGLP